MFNQGDAAASAKMARGAWITFAVLALLLILPLFLPGNPPLVDYPNHLARMVIAFDPSPALEQVYSFTWRNMSNLGLELSMAALTTFLPVGLSMEVFTGSVLLLSFGGAVALHAALYRRVSIIAGFAAFFVWGGALQFGFLSYCLGVAVALWGVAGWIVLARAARVGRLAYGIAVALALYYVHILALGAYGFVIAGIELDRLLRRQVGDGDFGTRLGTAAGMMLQFLPAAGLLLAGQSGGGELMVHFTPLTSKLIFLQRLFWNEALWVSALMVIPVTVVVGLSLRQWRLPLDPRLLPGVVFLALAVLLFPAGIIREGTPNWALDWRYLTPLALFGTAALRDPLTSARQQTVLALAICVVMALRAGTMMMGSWSEGAALEQRMRACFAALPEGSAMITLALPMERDVFRWPERLPPVINLSSYAVVDRAAFIPTLFAYDAQQPLRYQPEAAARRAGLEGMYFASAETVNWDLVGGYDYLLALARPGDAPASLVADLPLRVGAPLCEDARFGLFSIGG
jgi:hypothetical protein